jgi:outer membrane protein OmpU
MNNLKKIGLTALGTTLIASSAFAADMSVTGGASLSYDQTSDTVGGSSV